jgi:hypothetical protein
MSRASVFFLVAVLDSLYPVHHFCDPGVDAWIFGVGTPDSPGHDSDLSAKLRVVAVEQGAAGVALKYGDKHFLKTRVCP